MYNGKYIILLLFAMNYIRCYLLVSGMQMLKLSKYLK